MKAAWVKAGCGSAQRFAHLLGLEPSTYRKYERGDYEPNFETLTRTCELLKIKPNDVLPAAAAAGLLVLPRGVVKLKRFKGLAFPN